MGRIIPIKINSFHGGFSDDIREVTDVKFSLSKHFDIFTAPYRLVPYRSLEADTNDGSSATGMKQYAVKDFKLGTDGKLYGLGIDSSGHPKVVYKSTPQSGNWTVPSSAEGNAAVKNGCFLEYKNFWWGFQGTNQVWKYGDITGTPSFTDSVNTVGATITSVADGLIATDDQGYLAYNNKIVRIAADGTVTDAVLTLPSNLKVTSLENYGNYMAIACAPKDISTTGNIGYSRVFLWDLVSDDVQETIDWGEGALLVLGNIEGRLVGITDKYINSSLSAQAGSIVIRAWSGGAPQVMKEITSGVSAATSALKQFKVIKNNKLYFVAKLQWPDGNSHEGVFVFGRRNINYAYAVTIDTIVGSATSFEGMGAAGNFWFLAHSADGSIAKTDDTATYSETSVYESQKFNGGDSSFYKQLLGIGVQFDPLPSAATVTLKFRVDQETSWTTLFTCSEDNAISYEAVNEEGNGYQNFRQGKELQFRIESTGGAQITGLLGKMEELSNQIDGN